MSETPRNFLIAVFWLLLLPRLSDRLSRAADTRH